MKTTCFAWLVAGLLALSGTALAQTTPYQAAQHRLMASSAPAQLAPEAASPRPVLGGPPQPMPAAPQPEAPTGLALLGQLPLPAHLPQPAELAQVFPQCVRPVAGFRPDVAALSTATAVAGSPGLVVLTLPLGAAGVPAGGAAYGQRLKLLTAAGEQLVAVTRPAAAGSHALVVSAPAGLAGRTVFVVGLEHPTELALDYEALALLSLGATQLLAQQLAAMRQQLATLQQQLAATQQLNGALLLDHAAQEDLRQQLSLLQSQQAALSQARQRRGANWLND